MRLSDIAKKMLLATGLALPMLVGGAALYYRSPGFLPFAGGALLGTIASAAKILLLDRAVRKMIGMEPGQAANYARLQSLLRFAATGAALLIPALALRWWNVSAGALWGAAAAVLVYQLAIYSMKIFAKEGRRRHGSEQ